MRIYLMTGSKVVKLDKDGGNVVDILDGPNVRDIDFHIAKQKMYWADRRVNKVIYC